MKVPTSQKRAVLFISDGTGRQTCIAENVGAIDTELRETITSIRKLLARRDAKAEPSPSDSQEPQ